MGLVVRDRRSSTNILLLALKRETDRLGRELHGREWRTDAKSGGPLSYNHKDPNAVQPVRLGGELEPQMKSQPWLTP